MVFSEDLPALSLNECIDTALKNNLSLELSTLTVNQTALDVKNAYSSLYPSASAAAGISADFTDPVAAGATNPTNANYLAVGVSQNIYAPGLFLAPKAARLTQQSGESTHHANQLAIKQAVEAAYYDILTSEMIIHVYEENIMMNDENIRRSRAMYELGASKESDVLKYEVQRGQSEKSLVLETETLANKKRALNILMGNAPSNQITIQLIDPAAEELPDYNTARDNMLAANPELSALNRSADLRAVSLDISKQNYLPIVKGDLNFTTSSTDGTGFRNTELKVTATLPIFSGFSRKNDIEKEKIKLRSAQLSIDSQIQSLEQALLNLYSSWESYKRLITIQNKTLESAKRDLEIVNQQYEMGSSTILDKMNAQITVLSSQTDLVKTRYAKMILESKIRQLIGQ